MGDRIPLIILAKPYIHPGIDAGGGGLEVEIGGGDEQGVGV